MEPGASSSLTIRTETSMDPEAPVAVLVNRARAQWNVLQQPAALSGEPCNGFATPDWYTSLAPPPGSWLSVRGEAGYGDGDELNVLNFGSSTSSKCITQYFRSTFPVSEPELYGGLLLQLLVDDGAAVYLNGHLLLAQNLISTPTMNTKALGAVNGAEEHTFKLYGISAEWLVAGTNLIAVEVHQRTGNDNDVDMSFSLELDGVLAPIDPGEGATGGATTGVPSVVRTTVSLPSIAATIDESHPFTNYGADPLCKVDGVPPGAAGGASIACLAKWDVSAIPPEAAVRAAHVVADVVDASPDFFQVWALNTPWDHSTVSWGDTDMTSPADWVSRNGAGAEFGFDDYSGPEFPWAHNAVNSPEVGELIFTVPSSLVKQWINQPELAHGIAIYNPEKGNQMYFTTAEPGLQLVVTYDLEAG